MLRSARGQGSARPGLAAAAVLLPPLALRASLLQARSLSPIGTDSSGLMADLGVGLAVLALLWLCVWRSMPSPHCGTSAI